MQNWKKALVFGSLGAGAILALSGRRSVGIAAMAGGLAILAAEYPDKFEAVWENGPEYVQRATQIFTTLSKLAERFAEEAERRSVTAYHQFQHEYGG